jgi:hypothetical protein
MQFHGDDDNGVGWAYKRTSTERVVLFHPHPKSPLPGDAIGVGILPKHNDTPQQNNKVGK